VDLPWLHSRRDFSDPHVGGVDVAYHRRVNGADESDALDDLDAEPFQLAKSVPPVLRGVILNISWKREALFGLPLPVEHIPVSTLRWQLDLPWWRDGDRYFAVTPNQVRANPVRYQVQWRRTLDADLQYPIHLVATTPQLRILDGVHRLLKAQCMGNEHIRACRLDRDQLKKIVVPKRYG
jgi:hypothetical protein